MTTPLRIYVAAPYALGSFVAVKLHDRLRRIGYEPVSQWAEEAKDQNDDMASLTRAQRRAIDDANNEDMKRAHIGLIYGHRALGGQMFVEADWMHARGIPLVWINRPLAMSARSGICYLDDLEEAFRCLTQYPADRVVRSYLAADNMVDARHMLGVLVEEHAQQHEARREAACA